MAEAEDSAAEAVARLHLLDVDSIGQRVRELREARRIGSKEMGINRTYLSKVETGRTAISLEMVERLCRRFEIGPARLLGSREQFDAMLALEQDFVQAVLPYLRQLNETQRKEILVTLEAAPRQNPARTGRPRSVPIENPTSNGSRSCTEGKVSTTRCRI